jgi:hypothetical protein
MRSLVGLLAIVVAGCATPPPPVPEPVPAPREEPARLPPPAPCTCDEPYREIARLKHDLANKEAEIRDLRSQQREQIKVLQESSRQAARATVKLHRLATQADAASYIAEVEVALATLRSSTEAGSGASLFAVAQEILQSAAAPFARGDYGAAMDRAAQAQQLIAMLASNRVRSMQPARASELPFQVPIPLRVKIDSNLRRQPRGNAKVLGVLKESTPLTAHAYKGNWLRVEASDGRSGWVHQSLFTKQ